MLTFKEVVNADIDKLNTRLDTLSVPKSDELRLNIVVRNVPESENKNVNNKLNAVTKEGIILQGIQVAHAVRKRGFNGRSGVIIAKCKSSEDKKAIMKNKKVLKDSRNFKDRSIYHDKPRVERQYEANVRLLVDMLAKDKLEVRGSRVQKKQHIWHRQRPQQQQQQTNRRLGAKGSYLPL